MLGKITKPAVERLAPGSGWLWDTTVKGFGARRQVDAVCYYLRYRWGGQQRMKAIGRHGSPWTPDTARTEALRLLGLVAARVDPATERERKAETFGAEVERYLERKRAAMKPRSFAEVERHLLNHATPLHRLRLADIDRRTIAQRLIEIETESGAVARNRVRSSLSAFFAWAIREGLAELNPVAGTGKAAEGGTRERVLTDAELAEVWRSAGEDQFGEIIRLLILTGQRREEIGALRWSEINFDQGLIALPPERTKNRRLHQLPLSPQALAILKRQPQRKDSKTQRDLIFGYGAGPFSGWSDCKTGLDERLLAARREADRMARPMPDWRLHDLRRTVATGMADNGVLPHIVEAILNHVSGHRAGVAGVYNRARYEPQMREALERWAQHVEAIVSGREAPAPASKGLPLVASRKG